MTKLHSHLCWSIYVFVECCTLWCVAFSVKISKKNSLIFLLPTINYLEIDSHWIYPSTLQINWSKAYTSSFLLTKRFPIKWVKNCTTTASDLRGSKQPINFFLTSHTKTLINRFHLSCLIETLFKCYIFRYVLWGEHMFGFFCIGDVGGDPKHLSQRCTRSCSPKNNTNRSTKQIGSTSFHEVRHFKPSHP